MADFFQNDPNDPFYNPNAGQKASQPSAQQQQQQQQQPTSTSFNWSDASKFQSLISDLSTQPASQPSVMPSMMSQKQARMYNQQQQQMLMYQQQQMLMYQQQQQQQQQMLLAQQQAQAQAQAQAQQQNLFGQPSGNNTTTTTTTSNNNNNFFGGSQLQPQMQSNQQDLFGQSNTFFGEPQQVQQKQSSMPSGNTFFSSSTVTPAQSQQQQQPVAQTTSVNSQDIFGQSSNTGSSFFDPKPANTQDIFGQSTASSNFFDAKPAQPQQPPLTSTSNDFFSAPSVGTSSTLSASSAMPPPKPAVASPQPQQNVPVSQPSSMPPKQQQQEQRKPQNNPFAGGAPRKRLPLPKLNPFTDEFYAEFSKTYKQQNGDIPQQQQQQQKPVPLPQVKPSDLQKKSVGKSIATGDEMPPLKPAVPAKPQPQPSAKQPDPASFFDDSMPALKPAAPAKSEPASSFFDDSMPALKPAVPAKPQPQPPAKQPDPASFFDDSMPALKPAAPAKSEPASFFDDPMPALKPVPPAKPKPQPPAKQAGPASFFDDSMPALKPVPPAKPKPQPPAKQADPASFFDDSMPALKPATPAKPQPQPPAKQADPASFFDDSMPALKPVPPAKPKPQPPAKQADSASFFDDSMPALKPVDSSSQKASVSLSSSHPKKALPTIPTDKKKAEQPPPAPSKPDEFVLSAEEKVDFSFNSPQLSGKPTTTTSASSSSSMFADDSNDFFSASASMQLPPMKPAQSDKSNDDDTTTAAAAPPPLPSKPKPSIVGGVGLPGLTSVAFSAEKKADNDDFFSSSAQFPPMKPENSVTEEKNDDAPPPLPSKPPKPPKPSTDFFVTEERELPLESKTIQPVSGANDDFFSASVQFPPMNAEKTVVVDDAPPPLPSKPPKPPKPSTDFFATESEKPISGGNDDFFSGSVQFPPMKSDQNNDNGLPPPIPSKPSRPPKPTQQVVPETDFFAAAAAAPAAVEKEEVMTPVNAKPSIAGGICLPGLGGANLSVETPLPPKESQADGTWELSITKEELREYREMFRGCKANEVGKIGGGDVKRLWMQKRRNSDLKEIYILAKRDRSDKKAELSEVEFVMGLYIISRRNAGAPLPRIVTESEWLCLDKIMAEDDADTSSEQPLSSPPMKEVPMPPMMEMPMPQTTSSEPEEVTIDISQSLPPPIPAKPSITPEVLLAGSTEGGGGEEEAAPPPLPPKKNIEFTINTNDDSSNESEDEDAPPMPSRPKMATPPTLALPPTLSVPSGDGNDGNEDEEEDAPPMPPKPQNMLAGPLVTDSEDVDFELAPSLPPRSRPKVTDLNAWMREYKLDPSIQEVFISKGVRVDNLLKFDEDSLNAIGVISLRKRLEVYYAVWLSRKELGSKHGSGSTSNSGHHHHHHHKSRNAGNAGGPKTGNTVTSGRKTRKDALMPRGRSVRSRSFANAEPPRLGPPSLQAPPSITVNEEDEKKRRKHSRAIRRNLSDDEGSSSSSSSSSVSSSRSSALSSRSNSPSRSTESEVIENELAFTVPSLDEEKGSRSRKSRSPSPEPAATATTTTQAPAAAAGARYVRGRKRAGAFNRRQGTTVTGPAAPGPVAPPPKLVITASKTLDEHKTRTQEEAARECADIMHGLFVTGQVRMFYCDTYGDRKRAANNILNELKEYVGKIRKYAFGLKTTKDGGGFSDDEYALFTPLVDTLSVPDEVGNALSAKMTSWNKMSTLADCFNKYIGMWMQKFGEWFINRGRNIYAVEKCTARSRKFKNSIKMCEDMAGSQESPVAIETFFEFPSQFLITLSTLFNVNSKHF